MKEFPKDLFEQSDDVIGGFTAGLFFQAVLDGKQTITHSIGPDYVDFVLDFAVARGYDTRCVDLEDGLVDIHLTRKA